MRVVLAPLLALLALLALGCGTIDGDGALDAGSTRPIDGSRMDDATLPSDAAAPPDGASPGADGSTLGDGGAGPAEPIDCSEGCRYVRADAPPGGDGTDWDRAWTELPDELVRGTTYFVADGEYPPHTFATPEAGTQLIRVRKAVPGAEQGDHGTDVGWTDAYGDAQAVFTGTTSVWEILTRSLLVRRTYRCRQERLRDSFFERRPRSTRS